MGFWFNMKLLTYFAANIKLDADSVNIPNTGTNASKILAGGLNMVYIVAGVVAVIVIILAGYKYVTAAGDSAAIAKAKNTILYAVVGLVVIILAFTVTWFVIGKF